MSPNKILVGRSIRNELGVCVIILVCTSSKYKLCWLERDTGYGVSKAGIDEQIVILFSLLFLGGL